MPDPRIWPIKNVTDGFKAVAAATTEVLAANARRADTDFVNDSDEVIYLARGNDAVVGSGIRLNSNGGSYHIGTNNLFHGVINAISTVVQGTSNLTVSEGNKP